ncbi:ATPase [Streptomyces spiroverticillatus]|nr:histidine kinase [Streptomyces finlayi]
MLRFRPPHADLLLALAQTTVAVLLGQESVAQGRPALDLLGYVLLGLVNLPTAFRTRAPVAVCLLVHAAWIAYITAGYWPVAGSFGPMLAVYTVASLRPLRISVACTVLMGAAWVCAGLLDPRSSMPAVVAQAMVWPAALCRFGVVARRSAKLARRLREEQEERARREVYEERGRIARELHDVVAHHMSVISVQSGLAQFVFASDPPTARAALGTIADTSAEALEEMRRMLRLLRAPDDRDDENAPDAPMPGLARLAEMVERVRAGGVPVELKVTGTRRPLAPGVELCAYRVVQEALTNVLKHAPGAPTVVELRYRPHQVTVRVVNEESSGGEGVIPAKVVGGSGHGLIGMRERAKLYGGTISIGPHGGADSGGYEVRLDLPTSPRAARPEDDRKR